jgi:hypothetical protein
MTGYLPRFAVIIDGKTHQLNVARKLRWEAGTIVVFDRLHRLTSGSWI